MKTYSIQQVEAIADDAINALFASVQEALGVESGDIAALYLQGHTEQVLRDIVKGYIRTEINWGGKQ